MNIKQYGCLRLYQTTMVVLFVSRLSFSFCTELPPSSPFEHITYFIFHFKSFVSSSSTDKHPLHLSLSFSLISSCCILTSEDLKLGNTDERCLSF